MTTSADQALQVRAILKIPEEAELEVRVVLYRIWLDYRSLRSVTVPLREREGCVVLVEKANHPKWDDKALVNLHLAYSVASITGLTIEKHASISEEEAVQMLEFGARGFRMPPGMTWP